MDTVKKGIKFIQKHLISLSVILSGMLGMAYAFSVVLENILKGYVQHLYLQDLVEVVLLGLPFGLFLVLPFLLTLLNLIALFAPMRDEAWNRKMRQVEYITVFLGFLYSILVHLFLEIGYNADWTKQLYNEQVHTPVWTQGRLTVIVLSLVGIAGYLFLSVIQVNKVPPLMTVLAIAAMYLGVVECGFWILQTMAHILGLFPFNCIIIAAKTVRRLVYEWQAAREKEEKSFSNTFLAKINQKLINAAAWPVAAFVLMWPLLGILIGILVLFGQRPDSIIKAWTETSDWNLSRRVAPQNIYYDEHYLCTVAAGGHENIVKPLRLGERHGHQVIVNRQLCVANAFEQILEEKTPGLHRHVRHFYDNYGFPIARLIHSPYLADGIYFLMKPLEWFFLIVLYLTDVNPENRIAMQYMPAKEAARLQKCLREST